MAKPEVSSAKRKQKKQTRSQFCIQVKLKKLSLFSFSYVVINKREKQREKVIEKIQQLGNYQ